MALSEAWPHMQVASSHSPELVGRIGKRHYDQVDSAHCIGLGLVIVVNCQCYGPSLNTATGQTFHRL